MVGNGVTNWKYDCDPAYFHMAYYHGLISDRLYNGYTAHGCDFSYIDAPNPPPLSAPCNKIYQEFQNQTALVNEYDIFGKCWKNTGSKLTAKRYTPFINRKKSHELGGLKEVPPCVFGGPILDYFNNPLVKQQLNIKPESPKWDLCQDDIHYTPQQNATYWIYPKLVNRYKILKYSGDADGAVPTLGTQNWIADMGWPVTEKWRPYYITNMYGQQVAGYIEKRGTFTFVTVHGAGHMAPQWKRQETYHAIFNWINDQPI